MRVAVPSVALIVLAAWMTAPVRAAAGGCEQIRPVAADLDARVQGSGGIGRNVQNELHPRGFEQEIRDGRDHSAGRSRDLRL
jgi:hypothetical protein